MCLAEIAAGIIGVQVGKRYLIVLRSHSDGTPVAGEISRYFKRYSDTRAVSI